jgi:stage II sporulation protein D
MVCGMSQTGADSLAKQGMTCEEIIKHFYTGVEIGNL